MKLVHFSDTHVQLTPASEKQFAVEPLWPGDVRELFVRLSEVTADADALIFSGDATHGGSEDAARHFFDLLAVASHGKPVFMVMGNHDVTHPAFTDNFRRAVEPFPNVRLTPGVHRLGELDLLLVDNDYVSPAGSAVPYWRGDCFPVPVLTPKKAAALDTLLGTQSSRPATVVVHCPTHVGPPVLINSGHALIDKMQAYQESVNAVLDKHQRVRRVLSGHVHFNCTRSFAHGRLHQSLASFVEHPYAVRILEGSADELRSRIVSLCEPGDFESVDR